jgi:hypothetical protein
MAASPPAPAAESTDGEHVDAEKPHADANIAPISHDAASEWASSTRNPLNWSSARRWTIIVVLAVTNFVA